MEEQVGSGQSLDPKQLAKLLAPIRRHRNPEDLSRVMQVVQRSEVTLNEGLGSALVSGLAEEGRVADMRRVLQQMHGRLRMQGRASVLSLACRSVDADMALEHLAMWDTWQELPDSLVGLLVVLSRESRRPEVVERLLQTLHQTQQPVTQEVATEFRQWAESSQLEPFTCNETTVNFSGVCTNCKGSLDKALTEANHLELLDALKRVVVSEGLGFSPELISNTTQLHQLLSSATTPYHVIVDGLNVSRIASANFNVRQVMNVVNRVTRTLGGPVLVVARKHLAKQIDQLSPFSASRNFTVFTTDINEISDDICVIFAALVAGPDCYFISNDHMSDKVSMLSPEHARLFSLWQASRQITMHPNRVQLLYPADHSPMTQQSQAGWRIPLSLDPSPNLKDTWLLEGRQQWDGNKNTPPPPSGEYYGRPHWLCLARTA
jgi:pentatricopeptide repeat protein